MIVLVDDNQIDLNTLIKAIDAKGIPAAKVHSFQDAKEARDFIEDHGRRGDFPVAIVSDLALKKDDYTGRDLLEDAEGNANRSGSGLWTFMVTSHDYDPGRVWQPFSKYNKKQKGWEKNLAAGLAELFKDSFDLDKNNDFSPPMHCPLKDRLYLYSSGEASLFCPEDYDEREVKTFRLNPVKYERRQTAILMYRGRYIDTNQPPTLVRALLRWRTVCLDYLNGMKKHLDATRPSTPPRRILIKDIHTWEQRVNGEYLLAYTDEHGGKTKLPLKGLHNVISNFRNHDEIKQLSYALFRKEILCTLRQVSIRQQGEEIKYHNKDLSNPSINGLSVPDELQNRVSDGFMTRLHFVLTEQERKFYVDWKKMRPKLLESEKMNFERERKNLS